MSQLTCSRQMPKIFPIALKLNKWIRSRVEERERKEEGQEIDTNTFLICNLWRAINLSSWSCMRYFFMDFSLSSLHIWQQKEGERERERRVHREIRELRERRKERELCGVVNAGHVLARKPQTRRSTRFGGNTNDNYSLPSNERTNRQTAIWWPSDWNR